MQIIRLGALEAAEKLYRAEWGNHGVLYITAYAVIKRTPRGVRIAKFFDETQFVNLHATKQFASETEGEAVNQLLHRTRKSIEINEWRVRQAREQLEAFSKHFLITGA
jgi:hypothetical protein